MPLPGLIVAGCLISTTALLTNSGLTDSGTPGPPQDRMRATDLAALGSAFDANRDARAEAQLSRSLERTRPAPSPATASAPAAAPTAPKQPVPVAGLIQLQMNNASTIVRVGQSLGLPRRALIIGVATAMQESNLYNTASNAVPESFDYPHEGSSSDYDSVGLFQQRPSQGWGTVENLMKPAYQAEKFFTKLMQIDWASMSLAEAAQAVQVSAFPSAYAKHESRATTVVDALLG